jgi:HK97 family phage portal protein
MLGLEKLFRRAAAPVPEHRAGIFTGAGVSLGGGGYAASPALAENLSTVVACVNAIGQGLGALPARVYRDVGEGRVEQPNHPVSRLLRAPNPNQSWPDLIEWVMGQVLLHGNAVCRIEHDGAGRPTALIPLPWTTVQVTLLPGARLAYDVTSYAAPWGGACRPQRLLDGEVFHLRDRSEDGYVGRSRLSRAPAVISAAIGLQTHSSAIWEHAATPSGVLKVNGDLDEVAFRKLQTRMHQHVAGAENAKRVLVLDNGSSWDSISVSPEDAEVLDSRRFTVVELCRLFNVPPPIVQDYSHATFTNASQASTWFAVNTLAPWARKIEAEFARSIFADQTGHTHLEIDLSGLVRGDYATRWAANVAAVGAGILTADEVRAQEGFGPMPAVSKTPPLGASDAA